LPATSDDSAEKKPGGLASHRHVIDLVGNAFVTKSLEDFGMMNQEDARQLEGVADNFANAIAKHDSVSKFPLPDLEAEQLPQGPAAK
jgi:hypothetical protein